MHFLLTFAIFAACYLGLGMYFTQPQRLAKTFSMTGHFRNFSMLAILSLPFLIAAGGTFALVAAGFAGVLLGVYGRKVGLTLKQEREDAAKKTDSKDDSSK